MLSTVRILKINEVKSGTSKAGRPYSMQDCECILLDEAGNVGVVGVLMLPRELNGKVAPGDYQVVFAPGVDMYRRLTARVVSLAPVKASQVKP